jgi:hypothetical protein
MINTFTRFSLIITNSNSPSSKIVHMKYVTEYCILREARDFIVLIHWFRRSEDQSICIIAFSIKHPGVGPCPGSVRAWMNCGGYLIAPLKDNYMSCRVTQLMNVNIMKMPPFMLNVITKIEPTSLYRLRNFIVMGQTKKES